MNATKELSPHALQAGEVNLSSWTVTLTSGVMGWSWSAVHADGREAAPVLPGLYMEKANAEKAAVQELSAIERGDRYEEISGFDLQIRVRERGGSET